MGDHLLGLVAVLSNEDVDMIGHDGTGVAGVLSRRDGLGETRGDDLTVIGRDRHKGVLQDGPCTVVKCADVPSGGLGGLAPVVDLAQGGNDVLTYVVRRASPRIVGQPPSVCGPDQVMCDNHGAIGNQQRAKPQAVYLMRRVGYACSARGNAARGARFGAGRTYPYGARHRRFTKSQAVYRMRCVRRACSARQVNRLRFRALFDRVALITRARRALRCGAGEIARLPQDRTGAAPPAVTAAPSRSSVRRGRAGRWRWRRWSFGPVASPPTRWRRWRCPRAGRSRARAGAWFLSRRRR